MDKTKAMVANTPAAHARQAEVEAAQARQEQQQQQRAAHALGEADMLLARGGGKGGERKRIERIAPQ